MKHKKQRPNYSPEVRKRAVRLVREHLDNYPSRWATIESIAGKIGCTAQTGMKAHIGVDSKTKVIHAVVATAANVHDSAVLDDLLLGKETRVWGD